MKTYAVLGLTLLCALCGPLGCPDQGGLNPGDRGGVKAEAVRDTDPKPPNQQETNLIASKADPQSVQGAAESPQLGRYALPAEAEVAREEARVSELSRQVTDSTFCGRGIILGKDADSGIFTLLADNGRKNEFSFEERTRFQLDGRAVTEANLRNGQRVTVYCLPETGLKMATRVAIVPQDDQPVWAREQRLLEAEKAMREPKAADGDRAARRAASPRPPQ